MNGKVGISEKRLYLFIFFFNVYKTGNCEWEHVLLFLGVCNRVIVFCFFACLDVCMFQNHVYFLFHPFSADVLLYA